MRKQGPDLERMISEKSRKAGTDGRERQKADRLKLETRSLDEEDQGESRAEQNLYHMREGTD